MIVARYLRPSLSLLLIMTVILGFLYPLTLTGIAALAFPAQAGGSLLYSGTTLVGSKLIGQHFSDPKYFWGRPSATAPQPYNALASGGSNLGPLNPALIAKVAAYAEVLREADPEHRRLVPVELVTASASGLDPDISPEAADYQAARIAWVRNLPIESIRNLIAQHRSEPLLGILGESQVNVLQLNMALDALH